MRKIVVLTPIKNEAWILERFLTITSQFADHIIIADQRSSDASRAIYTRFRWPSAYHQDMRQLFLVGLKLNVTRHARRAPRKSVSQLS